MDEKIMRLQNRSIAQTFIMGSGIFLSDCATRRATTDVTYNVMVYGSTSGSVAAAVSAACGGKSVILVEPGQHLGGLTSSGLVLSQCIIARNCGYYQKIDRQNFY